MAPPAIFVLQHPPVIEYSEADMQALAFRMPPGVLRRGNAFRGHRAPEWAKIKRWEQRCMKSRAIRRGRAHCAVSLDKIQYDDLNDVADAKRAVHGHLRPSQDDGGVRSERSSKNNTPEVAGETSCALVLWRPPQDHRPTDSPDLATEPLTPTPFQDIEYKSLAAFVDSPVRADCADDNEDWGGVETYDPMELDEGHAQGRDHHGAAHVAHYGGTNGGSDFERSNGAVFPTPFSTPRQDTATDDAMETIRRIYSLTQHQLVERKDPLVTPKSTANAWNRRLDYSQRLAPQDEDSLLQDLRTQIADQPRISFVLDNKSHKCTDLYKPVILDKWWSRTDAELMSMTKDRFHQHSHVSRIMETNAGMKLPAEQRCIRCTQEDKECWVYQARYSGFISKPGTACARCRDAPRTGGCSLSKRASKATPQPSVQGTPLRTLLPVNRAIDWAQAMAGRSQI